MRFVVDQMLGTLATWLRLCGFDTFYADQEISDDELLIRAEHYDRILITRDKELHIRAKKKLIPTLYISSIKLDEQLSLVFESCPELKKEIHPLSRCSLCNTSIMPIGKEYVKEKVPEHVYQTCSKFWLCPHCKKFYWDGSHYEKIIKKIESFTS